MEWAYSAHSDSSLKIVSSRSGFVATAEENLLMVYKISQESIRPVGLAKRFDNTITSLALSSVYTGSGNNCPNLFVGTSIGKGYFVDISDMSVIAVFEAPSKSAFEGLILSKAITSTIWSPIYPASIFVGLANGQLFSVSLVKSHENTQHSYFTTINWSLDNSHSIDFLEFDLHRESSLMVASRTGFVSLIENAHTNDPIEVTRWKRDCNVIQCQFYYRIPNCVMMVTCDQIEFVIVDENRSVFMFPSPSKRVILGIWQPQVTENMIFVMTLSRIFVFIFEGGTWRRKTEMSYFDGHFVSHTNLAHDRVVVTTEHGSIVVYELRRGRLYMKNVYRRLPKPVSGSSNGAYVVLARGNTCYVSKDMQVIAIFQVPGPCEIDQVEWISDDSFVIAAHEPQRNKLLCVSMKTRCVRSILKPRHELLVGDNLKIYVCHGQYFAVSVGGSLLMFYTIDAIPKEISNNLFSDTFHVSFRNDHLVNIVTMKKCIVCRVKPYSQIMHIPINRVKEVITAATTFPDKWIVVGTVSGDVCALNLHSVQVVGKLKSAIQSFVVSRDMKYMIAIDDHKNFAVFDREFNMVSGRKRIKIVIGIDSDTALFGFEASKTLVMCKLPDHQEVICSGLESGIISVEESKEMFKKQIRDVKDLKQVLRIAENLNIVPVCDVLSPFSDAFNPKCYGMNISVERFHDHVTSLLMFLRGMNHEREIRLMQLVGKKNEVVTALLETSPEHPEFSKNAVKAAIASVNIAGDTQLKQMVESLIAGGSVNDAIDILILKAKYFDAIKLLVSTKNVELAVSILQTVLHGFDTEECISEISACIRDFGNESQFLSFLMSCEAYSDVIYYLLDTGDRLTAAVVKAIDSNEGKLSFDYQKFQDAV